MSENTNPADMLPDDVKEKPVPLQFLITIADALESRIDYNFNGLIQVSLLVEYLYEKLSEKGIEIKLDDDFKVFQESRLSDIQKEFEQLKNKANAEEAAKSFVDESINLQED